MVFALSTCLGKENPVEFMQKLTNKSQKTKRPRATASNVPASDDVHTPGFPLLTHLDISLLDGSKIQRSSTLARRMAACPELDSPAHERALVAIWVHLYSNGSLFLGGNLDDETGSIEFIRDFLYEHMMDAASSFEIETMTNFYSDVAFMVCDDKRSSSDEKEFVVLACQQTVMRLLIRAFGVGDQTVMYFIEKTKWPVDIVSHGATRNLTQWCNLLLEKKIDCPASLIDNESNTIDLSSRFGSINTNDVEETVVASNLELVDKPLMEDGNQLEAIEHTEGNSETTNRTEKRKVHFYS